MKRPFNNVIDITQNGEFYWNRAQKQLRKNEFFEAVKSLNKAVELDPDNCTYSFELAQQLLLFGCIDESNNILARFLASEEHGAEALTLLGSNYCESGFFEYAKSCFLKAAGSGGKNDYAHLIAERLEEMREEADYYNEALTDLSSDSAFGEARTLWSEGKYEECALKLEELCRDRENIFLPALNMLLMVYMYLNRYDEALKLAYDVIEADPENINAMCVAANICRVMGDKEECDKLIQQAIDVEPDNSHDAARLIMMVIDNRSEKEASELMQYYLQYDPYSAELLRIYAVLCYNLKDYRQALHILDKVRCVLGDELVTEWYYMQALAQLKGEEAQDKLSYDYLLPRTETQEYMQLLKARLEIFYSVPQDPVLLRDDRELFRLIKFVLESGNSAVFGGLLFKTMVSIGGPLYEGYLRALLLNPYQPDELKRNIIYLFNLEHISGPYLAAINGEVMLVKMVSKYPGVLENMVKVLDMTLEKMKQSRLYEDIQGYEEKLCNIWQEYYEKKLGQNHPGAVKKVELHAAALEYVFCRLENIRRSAEAIGQRYNVTAAAIYPVSGSMLYHFEKEGHHGDSE